jgi:hypothetical protein
MSPISSKSQDRNGRACLGERGESLAELALVLPMLMMILFGLIELGNAFTVSHALATISREGANIASRGAPLADVLRVVVDNGDELGLDVRGGSVASQITIEGGLPRVTKQLATPGYEDRSLIGLIDSVATDLSAVGFFEGSTHYVVEIFYGYESITPMANFLAGVIPDPIYEIAIF